MANIYICRTDGEFKHQNLSKKKIINNLITEGTLLFINVIVIPPVSQNTPATDYYNVQKKEKKKTSLHHKTLYSAPFIQNHQSNVNNPCE